MKSAIKKRRFSDRVRAYPGAPRAESCVLYSAHILPVFVPRGPASGGPYGGGVALDLHLHSKSTPNQLVLQARPELKLWLRMVPCTPHGSLSKARTHQGA